MAKFSYVLQPRDLRVLQRVTTALAGLLDGMTPDTAIRATPKRRRRRRAPRAEKPIVKRRRRYAPIAIPDASLPLQQEVS